MDDHNDMLDELMDATELAELNAEIADVLTQVSAVVDRAQAVKKLNRNHRIGRRPAELMRWMLEDLEATAAVLEGKAA
ncbi:hypothetical protein [Pseudonocardia nigra]|uniref:hypothetical protein n=1 Tax=Pseudonocardia nigra TaxID=1921578 RepID=UPI001C5E3754|nr:hypothetical protein [Pseudonocardia nigra]